MEVWLPPISVKGFDVYNDYHKFLFVEGARRSTKTNSIEHKLMRHAMENDGAIIGVFVKSKATGGGGIWNDLTCKGGIVDTWIAGGQGVSYAIEPKFKQDSKMAYFRLRTPPTEDRPLGGEVEFQLHSVFNENPKAVEDSFKSTSFTLIYLSEGDSFKQSTFTFLRSQLRSLFVPSSRFQMILDANPPEAGKRHWLYEVFFKHPDKNMHRIHFGIDDNDFYSPEEKQAVYDDYKHDKTLLDRYYYGKWVEASTEGIFAGVFLPEIHIVGEIPPLADPLHYEERDKWVILRPDSEATTFEEGWDVGDVNFGYVMGVPRFHPIHRVVIYDILDELCYLNTHLGAPDVVEEITNRREYWQSWQTKENGISKIRWTSWSDTSSMRHRFVIGGTEAVELYRLSNGQITLRGVNKGAGSVRRRKDLLMKLLFERRIYVSPLCVNVLAMLRSIKSKQGFAIDPESPHRHIFDALTYLLGYGLPEGNVKNDRMRLPPVPKSISVLV